MIAGRTYRELIDEVLSFQFSPGKYEALVKKWLNDGQRQIVREAEIRTQEATAAYETISGGNTATLPEDFARFIDFYGPSGELTQQDLRDFDELEGSSGAPTVFAVEGNNLYLGPIPDGAYNLTLRYWRLPADMDADTDEPSIPKLYHDLLPAYPMAKAYARENDYAASNFWKGEWEAGIGKLRGEVQSDMFQGPRQVAGTWSEPVTAGPRRP